MQHQPPTAVAGQLKALANAVMPVLLNSFLGFTGYSSRGKSPMTAMSRDHGDYPIFCLDTICGPYGGSAMIAWLLAFLVSRLQLGIP